MLAGAALVAVVAVAAVDTIRGRGDGDPATAPASLAEDGRVERLTELGARGELVLGGRDCRVQLLTLPSLEQTEDSSGCVPSGAESPDGSLVARCLGDETELFHASDGGLSAVVPGCTPAWRPDGILTVAYEREVVRFRACRGSDTCPVTLIARSELERAARRHPSFPDIPTRMRTLVDGIAWLSNAKAAVLLSIRVSRFDGRNALSAIAFFDAGRAADTRSYFRMTGGRLDASPRGTYITQTPDVILRADGSQVNLPQHLRDAHAFAWSPDERYLALAQRHAVAVLDVASLERYDRIGGGLSSVTLPVSVTKLSWR